jgi:hypothetical protein
VPAAVESATAALARNLLSATAPVFMVDSEEARHFEGSGILIAIAAHRFLITARHVLDAKGARSFDFGIADRLARVPLEGRIPITAPVGSQFDYLDLIIVPLRGAEYDQFPDECFAPRPQLCGATNTLATPKRESDFMVQGYPETKNRAPIVREAEVHAHYFVAAQAPLGDYARHGLDPTLNLLLHYNRKDLHTAAGKFNPPDPYGMSGSAAWHLDWSAAGPRRPPCVAAVVTRVCTHSCKHVIATRLTVALAQIALAYPTLAPHA